MRIRLDDIKDEGLQLEGSEEFASYPILTEMVEAGEVRFVSPVKTELRLYRVDRMIEVEGRVETVVELTCSRCLADFEVPLAARFALTYTDRLPDIESEDGEEVEVGADEMGLILFEGEEIDLREGIQEQVVMAVPYRPLCRKDCKGLCPECGGDRNSRQCDCESSDFSLKFAALKNFKVDK